MLALIASVTADAQEKEDAKHFYQLGMDDYQQGNYWMHSTTSVAPFRRWT